MDKEKQTFEERYANDILSNNTALNHYSQCKDCVFRDLTKVNGKECGYYKGNCDMFPYPQTKPKEVYNNTDMCEFYEKA